MRIVSEADLTVDGPGGTITGARRIGEIQGRRLAWIELGDPSGMPVFYGHGNPGSALELFFFHQEAVDQGLRLFAVDRPGFGWSDLQPDATLTSVARDVLLVADHHQLDYLYGVGWSSGGPPLLAMGHDHSDRLRGLAILSSFTNFGELPNGASLLATEERVAADIAEKSPHLFRGLIRAVGWTSRNLPDFYLKMAEADVGRADQCVLGDARRLSLFQQSQEATFRQGADGAIRDLESQWQAWPFTLREIGVPTVIYQGKRDQFVPVAFAEHLAEAIPESRLQVFPECGHLYPLEPRYQRRIFRELIELGTKKPA